MLTWLLVVSVSASLGSVAQALAHNGKGVKQDDSLIADRNFVSHDFHLPRVKRWWWSKDKNEAKQEAATEKPATESGKLSWLEKAKMLLKEGARKVKTAVQKGGNLTKQIGRKIKKGFLILKRRLTRSDENFVHFATKVKEKVESGDARAIEMLNKFGIKVDVEGGNVSVYSVNDKTNVTDVLKREGMFLEVPSNAHQGETFKETETRAIVTDKTPLPVNGSRLSRPGNSAQDILLSHSTSPAAEPDVVHAAAPTYESDFKTVTTDLSKSRTAALSFAGKVSVSPKIPTVSNIRILSTTPGSYTKLDPLSDGLKSKIPMTSSTTPGSYTKVDPLPGSLKSKTPMLYTSSMLSSTNFSISASRDENKKTYFTTYLTTALGSDSNLKATGPTYKGAVFHTGSATSSNKITTSSSYYDVSSRIDTVVRSSVSRPTIPFTQLSKFHSSTTPLRLPSSSLSAAEPIPESVVDYSPSNTVTTSHISSRTVKALEGKTYDPTESAKIVPTLPKRDSSTLSSVDGSITKRLVTATKSSVQDTTFARDMNSYLTTAAATAETSAPFPSTRESADKVIMTEAPLGISSLVPDTGRSVDNAISPSGTSGPSPDIPGTGGLADVVLTSAAAPSLAFPATEGRTNGNKNPSTEDPPFPDIFSESRVKRRLHKIFLHGDFSHEDFKRAFGFDIAKYDYEHFYYLEY